MSWVVGSYYNVIVRRSKRARVYNSSTGATADFDEDTWTVVGPALTKAGVDGNALDQGLRNDLFAAGFITASKEQDMRNALVAQRMRKYGSRVLSLIVMPTEQCNFRCRYCYESLDKVVDCTRW